MMVIGVDKSIAKSERFDYDVPSYKQMLIEQAEWMDKHKALYTQYF